LDHLVGLDTNFVDHSYNVISKAYTFKTTLNLHMCTIINQAHKFFVFYYNYLTYRLM